MPSKPNSVFPTLISVTFLSSRRLWPPELFSWILSGYSKCGSVLEWTWRRRCPYVPFSVRQNNAYGVTQVCRGVCKLMCFEVLGLNSYKWKIVESHFSVPVGLTFFSAPRKRFSVCKSHVSRIRLGVSDVHSWGLLTQINPGAQKFDCVVARPEQKYTHSGLSLIKGGFYRAHSREGGEGVCKVNVDRLCDTMAGSGKIIWIQGKFTDLKIREICGILIFFFKYKPPTFQWWYKTIIEILLRNRATKCVKNILWHDFPLPK